MAAAVVLVLVMFTYFPQLMFGSSTGFYYRFEALTALHVLSLLMFSGNILNISAPKFQQVFEQNVVT